MPYITHFVKHINDDETLCGIKSIEWPRDAEGIKHPLAVTNKQESTTCATCIRRLSIYQTLRVDP